MILLFMPFLFQRVFHQAALQQVRHRSRLPMNTIILFVPQQEAWIVERFGKFNRTLEPVSLRLVLVYSVPVIAYIVISIE